jgi:hypothetical protein
LHEACTACGAQLGGAAVEIRDGKVSRGWLARAGELPEPSQVLRCYLLSIGLGFAASIDRLGSTTPSVTTRAPCAGDASDE